MPGVFFASAATQATIATTVGFSDSLDGKTGGGLATGNFSESKYRKAQTDEADNSAQTPPRVPDNLAGFRHGTMKWGGSGSLFFFNVVMNPLFRFFVNVTIVVNAIQMGAAADHQDEYWRGVWLICDYFFTAVFVLEMILKILGLGKDYFLDGWNILDFLVAWISVVDCWIIASSQGEGKGLGVVRVFRLLRLLRMTKVLRVVPELVVVLEGILHSMRSMFWVLLLLTIILYAFAIICVEVIGSSTDYSGAIADKTVIRAEASQNFNSWQYFGSLSRSMVSLFSLIILSEWSSIVRPIWEVQMPMIPIFIFLVVLTTFGVLNVIIGIIVERTTAAMNAMREKQYKALKREQMHTVEKLADIMFELDQNSDEKITLPEFEAGAGNERLMSLLRKIDFPIDFRFEEVHQMLDLDGSGGITKNEFVNGIMRLIYCNQFQRDCLLLSSLGQIKAMQKNFAAEMRRTVNSSTVALRKEIKALRKKMSEVDGAMPHVKIGSSPDCSSNGTDEDVPSEQKRCIRDCHPTDAETREQYFMARSALHRTHDNMSSPYIVDLDRVETMPLGREWEPYVSDLDMLDTRQLERKRETEPTHQSLPSVEVLPTRCVSAQDRSGSCSMPPWELPASHYSKEASLLPKSFTRRLGHDHLTHGGSVVDAIVHEPIDHAMVELIQRSEGSSVFEISV